MCASLSLAQDGRTALSIVEKYNIDAALLLIGHGSDPTIEVKDDFWFPILGFRSAFFDRPVEEIVEMRRIFEDMDAGGAQFTIEVCILLCAYASSDFTTFPYRTRGTLSSKHSFKEAQMIAW